MDEAQLQDTLRKGIRAARRGHNEPAQELLAEVLQADPQNEEAWSWMARVVQDPEQKVECLNRVLSLNPDNQWAAGELESAQEAIRASIQGGMGAEGGQAAAGPVEAGEPSPLEPISAGYDLEVLNCPNCGAPLELHRREAVKAVVCDSCGSVLDLTVEQAAVIGEANKKGRALLPIELGAEATIDKVLYQVIGWLRYEGWDSEDRWRWDEWLLASESGEYRWLSYDPEDGFLLQKRIPITNEINYRVTSSIEVPGGQAQVVERAPAKVIALAGELTWRAKVGEEIKYMDAERDDYYYSVEFTEDEVELLGGIKVPETEIWQGFGNQEMVEALEKQGEERSAYKLLAQGTLVLFLIGLIGMVCSSLMSSTILNQQVQIPQNVMGISSNTFSVDAGNRLHQVTLTAANPTNDWGAIEVSLRDDRENTTRLFTKQFGLGDNNVSHVFRPGQNGTYRLFLSLSEGTVSSATVTVKVDEGVWAGRYMVLFACLTGILAFAFFLMQNGKIKPPYSHTLVDLIKKEKADIKE